jgi:hypothetical protein
MWLGSIKPDLKEDSDVRRLSSKSHFVGRDPGRLRENNSGTYRMSNSERVGSPPAIRVRAAS